ncbi:hypothetical protein [Carboxylicivirga marina]|uniref:Uncharacterized protein n=1 Tax=Carboxylicivirga marina TaxID=2800988 RepID=A0ABS1HIX6_9BACT|nr:hypothetical protein [Carboxylicivirga marina]MBK3517507.1 hypothetical protein [Carboxylicivirga marina]
MKNLVLMVLVVLLCGTAIAQEKKSKKSKKYKKVESIYPVYLELCELNEEQKTALYSLLINRQNELTECKKEYKNKGEEASKALVEIRKSYLVKMEELIGQENMTKMQEYKSSQIRMGMKELEASL